LNFNFFSIKLYIFLKNLILKKIFDLKKFSKKNKKNPNKNIEIEVEVIFDSIPRYSKYINDLILKKLSIDITINNK